MTSTDPETKHEEIIIVRRGGEGHGGHHGGAWKIAYADFMTAMMAFFLVMWLINAANEETKAAVASYFNPIKLVDRRTNPRGIQENTEAGNADVQTSSKADDKEHTKTSAASEETPSKEEEAKMMSEPYEALDEIAAEENPDTKFQLQGEGGASEGGSQKGASEGTAYRDPFSPDYWSKNAPVDDAASVELAEQSSGGGSGAGAQENTTNGPRVQVAENPQQVSPTQSDKTKTEELALNAQQTGDKPLGPPQLSKSEDGTTPTIAGGQGPAMQASEEKAIQQAMQDGQNQNTGAESVGDKKAGEEKAGDQHAGAGGQAMVEQTPEEAANNAALDKQIRDLAKDVETLIQTQGNGSQPAVRIVPQDGGVTIELTDQMNYGMFSIGSAKPDKEIVNLLQGVGEILKKRSGDITISGYTDARPFKKANYDNWQLSTARAQMAYYMLVRGGLDEKRIVKVEGHADRDLKNPANPFAAENRRIGIFIKLKPEGKHNE